MRNPESPGYQLWMTHRDYLRFVRARPEKFGPNFAAWLEKNARLWERFKSEADRIRRRRSHYSARTIIEFLRHETECRESGSAFKIGNNAVPDMARLYMMTTDGAEGFFETREGR